VGLSKRLTDWLDVRCNMEDARLAVECGVDGVDVVIGTSSFLQKHSHGKDMDYITKSAIEVINYIKRFACPCNVSPGSNFR
jgi:homocitrate synthase